MTTATIARPQIGEYFEYYETYVSKVPDGDIVDLLAQRGKKTHRSLATLTEAQALHRYGEGKWSVKEVVGHLCDSERVFAYRALRIGRGDQTPLSGFEHLDYIKAGQFDTRSIRSLADEFLSVRAATVSLLRDLPADAAARSGETNGFAVSARALAYIIAGHEEHHLGLLKELYGIDV